MKTRSSPRGRDRNTYTMSPIFDGVFPCTRSGLDGFLVIIVCVVLVIPDKELD